MYLYNFSAGNPEGTDWSYTYYHKKLFNHDKFQEICENAILYSLNKQKEKDPDLYPFIDSCYIYINEYMLNQGFKIPDIINYDIEPYWSKKRIKNKEILKILDEKFK
jgi:hypothetical protein